MQNGVYRLAVADAEAVLARAGATILRAEAGRRVYVSKTLNKTFTVTRGSPGTVVVQVIGGCAC